MNSDGSARVLSIAGNQYASIEEGRQFGEAVADAILESDRRVAVLASGSLSHQFWPNHLSAAGINEVNTEFNRQVDLRVLELWQTGRIKEFLAMLPDYRDRCFGEGGMIDTAHLFGVLGWDAYEGSGEIIGDYFGSSGTGQVNVIFELPGERQ
jgi:3,4-dihydroxyphenylacetate 2,3-dioxygenase